MLIRHSITRISRTHTVSPVYLHKDEAFFLRCVLNHYIRQGRYTFNANEVISLPPIDQTIFRLCLEASVPLPTWTSISLTHAIQVILKTTLPKDGEPYDVDDYFHCDVLSGKWLANGAFGQIGEVIGSLDFVENNSLNFISGKVHTFNPAQLTPFQNHFLSELLNAELRHDKTEKLFDESASYPFLTNGNVDPRLRDERFRLSYILFRRLRESLATRDTASRGPTDYRYELLPPGQAKLGGVYGEVKFSDGVLEPLTDNTLVLKQRHQRLIKLFTHKSTPESINAEASITRLMTAFHLKHPVFHTNIHRHSMMMKRMPGENMYHFLDRDKSLPAHHPAFHPTGKRLEMMVGCVYALMVVHFKKIRHRDIKDENVIVNALSTPPEIAIVDFGLSCLTTNADARKVGTLLYAPPEYFAITEQINEEGRVRRPRLIRPLDEKSDIFSMAWILARIMRANDHPLEFVESVDHGAMRRYANNVVFESLFRDLNDLDAAHQAQIRGLLQSMVLADPDARMSLPMVLGMLESVILHRKLSTIANPLTRQQLIHAHDLGTQCRQTLFELLSQHIPAPGETSKPAYLMQIAPLFASTLNRLGTEDVTVIQHFISLQHIQFLHGLTTKEAINEIVANVIHTFTEYSMALLVLSDNLILQPAHPVRDSIHRMIVRLLEKSDAPLTLDEIHDLGRQFKKYHQRYQAELQQAGLAAPASAHDTQIFSKRKR